MKFELGRVVDIDLANQFGVHQIAPLHGDPTQLARWQEVSMPTIYEEDRVETPRRLDPRTYATQQGLAMPLLEHQLQAATELAAAANEHFDMLRRFGALVVPCKYMVVDSIPDGQYGAGIMALVPRLPPELVALGEDTTSSAYDQVIHPVSAYTAWAITHSDVVLNDLHEPHQWSVDSTDDVDPVLHDVGAEFIDVYADGALTMSVIQLVKRIVTIAEQVEVPHAIPDTIMSEVRQGYKAMLSEYPWLQPWV